MNEEAIKEAFERVKQDMFSLGSEISEIKSQTLEIREMINTLNNEVSQLKLEKITKNSQFIPQNNPIISSTHKTDTSTHTVNSTDTSTVPHEIEGLSYPNLPISTGNEGVSTDRQTHQQTDTNTEKPIIQHISEASEILDSLDNIKKEIRLKFKKITNQEMLIFSTIYQLEEQDPNNTDYKTIAQKLNLSQSSIRDYVSRITTKGIPILKNKVNNKKILLGIPQNLRKIASLNTIIQLREL